MQAARAGSVLPDDSQPIQNFNNAGSEENAAKILTYEEAFKQIKEATGVSDTAEVVERSEDILKHKIFNCMSETHSFLQQILRAFNYVSLPVCLPCILQCTHYILFMLL